MVDKKNNTGENNNGNRNSGDRNSGNWNSGDSNSGNWNSGDRNSGYFNTNEPNARFFNRESNIKLSDFENSDACPNWDEFYLNNWVNKEDMTDEEKEKVKGWETTGGYLKILDYKEAWKIFWEKISEENRQKFLNLPNFDADIFFEITGINIKKTKLTGKIIKIKLKNGRIFKVEGTIVED